jgi:hypothetical protein
MSGGVPFDPAKFEAVARYVCARHEQMRSPYSVCSTRLSVLMWRSDFDAFARLGRSITGATWCKGRTVPYCREMGEGWASRFIFAQQPLYARLLGRLLAVVCVARCVWGQRA